jgi:hypothetical protein
MRLRLCHKSCEPGNQKKEEKERERDRDKEKKRGNGDVEKKILLKNM